MKLLIVRAQGCILIFNPRFHSCFKGPEFHSYQEGPGFHSYLENPGFHSYQEGPGFHSYMENPRINSFLENPGFHSYLEVPGFHSYLEGAKSFIPIWRGLRVSSLSGRGLGNACSLIYIIYAFLLPIVRVWYIYPLIQVFCK